MTWCNALVLKMQLIPFTREHSILSPETNMVQDTSDHPTTAVRAVNNNIYTNEGSFWNSRRKQKHNWTDALITLGPIRCRLLCLRLQLIPMGALQSGRTSHLDCGKQWIPGVRSYHCGKCFFTCIAQCNLVSYQPFRVKWLISHRLIHFKETFLLGSDKSSINFRYSPLSPHQR